LHPQRKYSPNSIDLEVGRTPEKKLRKFYWRQNSPPLIHSTLFQDTSPTELHFFVVSLRIFIKLWSLSYIQNCAKLTWRSMFTILQLVASDCTSFYIIIYTFFKQSPLQAWTDSKGSRRLRLQDFKPVGTWRW
jgi:hypothetical protein